MKQVLVLVWFGLVVASPMSAQELKLQKMLVGDGKSMPCLAFSPDGKILASGNVGRKVVLWNLATGKNVATLTDTGVVFLLEFSPDSRILASSSTQGTINLWDITTGKTTNTIKTYNFASFIKFSRDGRTLMWTDETTGGKNPKWADHTTIKLWHLDTGENTLICSAPKGAPCSMAFSQDGRKLAVRNEKGTIEIWDMVAGKKTVAFSCRAGDFFCLAFSPDGKSLASSDGYAQSDLLDLACGRETKDRYRVINLWNATTGQKDATLTVGPRSVEISSLAFSPDSKTLAACGTERMVRLWDVATRKSFANVDTGSKSVTCVAFNPNGTTLASAGADGVIRLYEVARRGGSDGGE